MQTNKLTIWLDQDKLPKTQAIESFSNTGIPIPTPGIIPPPLTKEQIVLLAQELDQLYRAGEDRLKQALGDKAWDWYYEQYEDLIAGAYAEILITAAYYARLTRFKSSHF